MKRINEMISMAVSTLRAHMGVSFLAIILIAFSYTIIGIAFSQMGEREEKTKVIEEMTDGDATYFMGEILSDNNYYEYINGSDEEYDRLKDFKNKLHNNPDFSFITINSQGLDIKKGIVPPEMSYYYSEETGDYAFYSDDELDSIKAIEVSNGFFERNKIKVQNGNFFDCKKEYYSYDEIPVLLGAAYKETFNVGDVFNAEYIGIDLSFRVCGILAEDSFFLDYTSRDYSSLDRYMIYPCLEIDTDEMIRKVHLLQLIYGVIYSSMGYEKTSNTIRTMLSECGISHYEISLFSEDEYEELVKKQERYTEMTKTIATVFSVFVLILSAVSLFGLLLTIYGMVCSEWLMYSISFICGAGKKTIVGAILIIMMIMYGCGFGLYVLFDMVKNESCYVMCSLFWISVIAVIVSGVLIAGLVLKKMTISEAIRGKE